MGKVLCIVSVAWLLLGAQAPEDLGPQSEAKAIAFVEKLGGTYRRDVSIAGGGPVDYVNLCETDVSDKDLTMLKSFKSLTHLSLSHTSITDQGIRVVADIGGIEYLNLNSTKTTNAVAKELVRMKSLAHLYLGSVKLKDDGITELAQLRLQTLIISRSDITDAGLASLSKCTTLTTLHLAGTNITDAGLVHLHSLKGLLLVSVNGTRVSSEGIRKLKEQLPKCGVVHGGPEGSGGPPPVPLPPK
jgi:hypothetical protein